MPDTLYDPPNNTWDDPGTASAAAGTEDRLFGIIGGRHSLVSLDVLKGAVGGGLSGRVVFLSQIPGFVNDYDRTAGLGTNNSTVINNALSPGTTLVVDADTMFDQIVQPAGSAVDGLNLGFIMKRKGRPNSGGPPFVNQFTVAYPTTPIDGDIAIRNVLIDANRRAGGAGNSTTLVQLYNDSGYVVPVIVRAGVTGAVIENVRISDQTSYGVQFSNCVNPFALNFGAFKLAGDTLDGNDIIHCNGGTNGLLAFGVRGWCNDDCLSLCANDGNDIPGATVTFAPGTVGQGPIWNIRIYGASFLGGANLIRLLSALAANGITDVKINGLSGAISFAGMRMDNFTVPGDGGWYDAIRIRNMRATGNWATSFAGTHTAVVLIQQARFGVVAVENLTSGGIGAAVNITDQAIGRRFEATHGRFDSNGLPPVECRGDLSEGIKILDCDPNITPDPAAPAYKFSDSPFILAAAPGPKRVYVRGSNCDFLRTVLRADGVTPDICLDGITHRYSKGGPLLESDTLQTRVNTSGYDGDHLTEIPVGSAVKHDGAGWYAEMILRDYARGTVSTPLDGHTPDFGLAWRPGTVGAVGQIQQTGNGFLFSAGADSYSPAGSQPVDWIYELEFDSRVLTSSSNRFIAFVLGSAANLSDRVVLQFRSNGFAVVQVTTDIQTTAYLPTTGGAVARIKAVLSEVGDVKTIKTYKSVDDSVTWTSLMADAVVTTTAPTALASPAGGFGLYTFGGAFTPTTGLQVGFITVRKRVA